MIGRGTPRTIRRIDRMTDLVSGLEPERMPSPTLGDHDSRARDRQSHIRHKLLNVEYLSHCLAIHPELAEPVAQKTGLCNQWNREGSEQIETLERAIEVGWRMAKMVEFKFGIGAVVDPLCPQY